MDIAPDFQRKPQANTKKACSQHGSAHTCKDSCSQIHTPNILAHITSQVEQEDTRQTWQRAATFLPRKVYAWKKEGTAWQTASLVGLWSHPSTYNKQTRLSGWGRSVVSHAQCGWNTTVHDTHRVCGLPAPAVPLSLYRRERKETTQQLLPHAHTQTHTHGTQKRWVKWRMGLEKRGGEREEAVGKMEVGQRVGLIVELDMVKHTCLPWVSIMLMCTTLCWMWLHPLFQNKRLHPVQTMRFPPAFPS